MYTIPFANPFNDNGDRLLRMYLVNLKHNSFHCGDVIMGAIASQITSFTIVYSSVFSDVDERKFQSSASLAFVRGIHRGGGGGGG